MKIVISTDRAVEVLRGVVSSIDSAMHVCEPAHSMALRNIANIADNPEYVKAYWTQQREQALLALAELGATVD